MLISASEVMRNGWATGGGGRIAGKRWYSEETLRVVVAVGSRTWAREEDY